VSKVKIEDMVRQDFPFATTAVTALCPTMPPVQLVLGVFFLRVKHSFSWSDA